MTIPEFFTPSQKIIVRAYIEVRSVPRAAELTFHHRNSSFVRQVVREYKRWLRQEDARLHPAVAI